MTQPHSPTDFTNQPIPCNAHISALLDTPEFQVEITRRSQHLAAIALELKAELHGIDDVIDRVIESIRAWYVLPQIIKRPVIVSLWGLTGTGKTQLTRSLAQKLNFYNRFVEVHMDGFSNSADYRQPNSISEALSNTIEEGEPGIVVLDEFQRFRTIDAQGKDVNVQRFMDVWALLSDGRMAPSLSIMQDLQMSVAEKKFKQDRKISRPDGDPFKFSMDEEDVADADGDVSGDSDGITGEPEIGTPESESAPGTPARGRSRKFQLSPYSAREIKSQLKRKESIVEIMTWSPDEVLHHLEAFLLNPKAWEQDYSKLLIFVCGNLDELYERLANSVEDCDTDADIFHRVTRQLSVIDVKRALLKRFKPEQIARLGNCHIIYPSFSRATYEHLVTSNVARYLADMQATSGLQYSVSQALKDQIYINGVFPSQGTRPLFSTIHSVLSGALVQISLWAIEQGAVVGDLVELDIQTETQQNAQASKVLSSAATPMLIARWNNQSCQIPTNLEITALKNRGDEDYRSLLAVHEAGHALVYSLLNGHSPVEVKINPATYLGGYNLFVERKAKTAANILDAVCVNLGGRAAERVVFGEAFVTSGAATDLKHATQMLAEYVRYFGFSERLTRTDRITDESDSVNTDLAPTNGMMETLMREQYERAQSLLAAHSERLVQIAQALRQQGELTAEQLQAWLQIHPVPALGSDEAGTIQDTKGTSHEQSFIHPFAGMLNTFAQGQSELFKETRLQTG